MKFLDYLFYIIYNYYKRNGEKESNFAASIVTMLAPTMNILTVIFLLDYFLNISFISSKWDSFYFSIPAMIWGYNRYTRIIYYKKVAIRISEYSEIKRNKLSVLCIVYMVTSFILFIGLAGYIGETRNPPPFWERWFK